MVDQEEVAELVKKKARRDVLATLKMVYPGSFSFRDLCLTLPNVEREYLKKDVSYLVDKKCVSWANERPAMDWDKREFKLTALGVETADRINKDPALEP